MGFPRQAFWSGLPFPPLRDLPNPGIKPRSPALQANSLPFEPPRKPSDISFLFPPSHLSSNLSFLEKIYFSYLFLKGAAFCTCRHLETIRDNMHQKFKLSFFLYFALENFLTSVIDQIWLLFPKKLCKINKAKSRGVQFEDRVCYSVGVFQGMCVCEWIHVTLLNKRNHQISTSWYHI